MNEKEIRGSLLVIDDEEEILKSLKRQFRKKYNVYLANSAEEGSRILCDESVQVIISDQRMPGMTGTEFFHKIKTEHPDAIRLILTAYADIEAVIAAINDGNVFRYIHKPWEPEQIEYVVSEAFRYYRLINGNRKLMQELRETNEILRQEVAEKEMAQQQIRQHRDHLEQTVQERTEALTRINALLYQEIEGHRQTAAELQTAKEKADSANRAKSEFLAHMSHELRTPLNGILGYAQILRQDRTLSESQRSGVEIIERSGNHLLNLLNDILDLSKIEAGKMELSPVPLVFPLFLKGISEMVSIRAQEKGLDFRYEISPSLPQGVLADEQRLGQVLLNLLNNAIKFTDSGSVIFRVEPAEREEKEKGSRPVRFQVKDTGMGIPKEHLENIFSPFRQIASHKHKTKGTGLGLSITRNLVQLMGGKISVQSEPGKGSVFCFDLELPEVSEAAEVKSKADKRRILGFQGKMRKILVVDDKAENRSLISDILSPLGFEIREAENGREGIAKALEFMPDLIFMDLLMPVMDGFEAAMHLRKTEELENVRIIALSADIFDEVRQRSLAAGCDDYVSKPVDMNRVLEKVSRHLHLEWIYEENMPQENAGQARAELVPPPAEILAELKKMADVGDIGALRAKSDEILAGDDQFRFFAKELRRLTKTFEIDRIQHLLEKCRGN